MEIIVMAAILDFNRKWMFFRLPPYLKLKILLKTMFVLSFMLVPKKTVFFDILQLSAGLLISIIYLNIFWYLLVLCVNLPIKHPNFGPKCLFFYSSLFGRHFL